METQELKILIKESVREVLREEKLTPFPPSNWTLDKPKI
jgi:hypothetical protein